MKAVEATIRETAYTLREQHVVLLRELIAIPSPAGSEEQIQQSVVTYLESFGAEITVFEADLTHLRRHPEYAHHPDEISTVGRPNVVARFQGAGQAPSLLLYAHPDTEPLESAPAWRFDPLAGILQHNRLYGLGAADDKAGLAAILAVGQILTTSQIRLKGDLTLVSCIGKRGGAAGALAVIDRGYQAAGVIYAHPTETGQGYRDIKTLSRGVLPFSIRVAGYRPEPLEIGTPHSALPHQGVSAIEKAAYLLKSLGTWDRHRGQQLNHPILREQLGRATTLTIGEIHASPGADRIPIWCELRGVVTFPPGESLKSVQAGLARAVQEAGQADAWLAENQPQLRFGGPRANAAEIAPDHPFVQLASDTIQEVTGTRPRPYAGHLQSDIRFPLLIGGMPTVGFGPMGGNFYSPDEWVDVNGFWDLIVILALLSVRWCGTVLEGEQKG